MKKVKSKAGNNLGKKGPDNLQLLGGIIQPGVITTASREMAGPRASLKPKLSIIKGRVRNGSAFSFPSVAPTPEQIVDFRREKCLLEGVL
jgi:hypothetical protein